jgi:hypothetical protein
MRDIIVASNKFSGYWIVCPLHEIYKESSSAPRTGEENQQDSETLIGAAVSSTADGSEDSIRLDGLKSDQSTLYAIDGSGPQSDPTTSTSDCCCRNRPCQLERRLIESFVQQCCDALALECLLSVACSSVIRRFEVWRGPSQPIRPTFFTLAGVCAVGIGAVLLERCDRSLGSQGKFPWVCRNELHSDDESEGMQEMPDFSMDQTVEAHEMQKSRHVAYVTLACHRASWRTTAHALMVGGFTLATAPLLSAQAEDRSRSLALHSLLGSSLCVSCLGFFEEMVKRVPKNVFLISSQHEQRNPRSDHIESNDDLRVQRGNAGAASMWSTYADFPENHLQIKASWVAAAILGGCAMWQWVRRQDANARLPWESLVLATGRPVFLLSLAARDFRNKYLSSRLRVFCPPHTELARKGASKALQMWHSSDAILDYNALKNQLTSLQVPCIRQHTKLS